jgi:small conductance mechanosensitive channel
MWGWFMANSLWFLIGAGLVLLLSFFFSERARHVITRLTPERFRDRLYGNVTVVFWTMEGIAFAIVILAFAAMVLSEEGVGAMLTPQVMQKWFLAHGIKIIIILVVGMVLWASLKRFLPPLMHRAIARPVRGESREGLKRRADTLQGVFMGLGKVIIILFVIFMVLSELTVNIGPILAGFGVVGIAVGFGAQYLIRDLIAGVFILMENQYRVGDVARVADVSGLVEEVNLRKTVLRDLDGVVHHVPNGEIRVASNYSRHFSRVNLNISVAYNTDLDHAISVINRVCQEMAEEEKWSKVIRTVPQVLRVDNLGDSGIDIKILGDVKPLEQWNVAGELRLRLKRAFDAEGIEIPWPHIKVYFGNKPGGQSV